MIWVYVFLSLYFLIGLSIGWILLGLGNKTRRLTFVEEITTRFQAIAQDPKLILFPFFMAIAWLPMLGIITYSNRKNR